MHSLNSYMEKNVSELTNVLYMAIYNRTSKINSQHEELLKIANNEHIHTSQLQKVAQHIYFLRDELQNEITTLTGHFSNNPLELEKCLKLEDFNFSLLCDMKNNYKRESFIKYKTNTAVRQILLNKGLITQKEFHL